MSLRCVIGWHSWSVVSHHLGVRVPGIRNPAWDFNQHCYRCGKSRRKRYWLPPQ